MDHTADFAVILTDTVHKMLASADSSVDRLRTVLANKTTRDAFLLQAAVAAGAVITVGGLYYAGKRLFSAAPIKAEGAARAPAGDIAQTPALELNKYEKIIMGDMVDQDALSLDFDDIGGLDDQIRQIEELVIYPLSHPHLYQHSAVAQQPTGLLLYGPPGTGKTLMAKAIAKTARASFVNVNVAHIQSKWFGETPKLVESIFTLARKVSPCVVFVDEIDGVLSARNDMDMQHVNTMKTKFMECWDGLTTPAATKTSEANIAGAKKEAGRDWVLVIGATNKPWALDPAVLRRMPRQLYVGLPDSAGRASILKVMLRTERVSDKIDLKAIADAAEGYSGSDLKELLRAAALIPIREAVASERAAAKAAKARGEKAVIGGSGTGNEARALCTQDFFMALETVKPTGVAANTYKQKQASSVTGFGGSAPAARGPSRPSDSRAVGMEAAPSYAPTASLRLNTMQLSSAIEGSTAAAAAAAAAQAAPPVSALKPRSTNQPIVPAVGSKELGSGRVGGAPSVSISIPTTAQSPAVKMSRSRVVF